MSADEIWVRQVKRKLKAAGFTVTVVPTAMGIAAKKASRKRDLELIATGRATSSRIQRRNSFFRGRAKQFRIVDYGGLNT